METAKFSHVGAGHVRHYSLPKNRQTIIKRACVDFARKKDTFDTFVATGYSGTTFASILAARWNKGLLIVRKPGVDDHRSIDVEGVHGTRCVFIDDIVCTGVTCERVDQGLIASHSTLVGVWMFTDAMWNTQESDPNSTEFHYNAKSAYKHFSTKTPVWNFNNRRLMVKKPIAGFLDCTLSVEFA